MTISGMTGGRSEILTSTLVQLSMFTIFVEQLLNRFLYSKITCVCVFNHFYPILKRMMR